MNMRRLGTSLWPVLAICLVRCDDGGPTVPGRPRGLTDPTVALEVLSTYPRDGTTGPFNLANPQDYAAPHFVVELNKLVDRNRFRANWFRVEGFAAPVDFVLGYGAEGGPGEPSPLTRILPVSMRDATKHNVHFAVGRTYTVTVDTTLTDFSGRTLQRPVPFSFTPEPWFRVLRLAPDGNLERIDVDSTVWLTFNSPVDSTILGALHVAPPVAGTWRRADPYSFMFRPAVQFAFNTRYTFSVDPSAADSEGHHLRAGFQSQARTVPFEIDWTSPRPLEAYVEQRGGIYLTTSAGLDVSSVAAAFHLEPALAGRLIADRHNIAFVDNTFELETRYTVTISTALRSLNGTHLASPYTLSFTTNGLSVRFSQPRVEEAFASRDAGIDVSFNSEIDAATVPQAFSIEPSPPGQFMNFPYGFRWMPDAPLAPGAYYTFTVSRALKSPSGHALMRPYSVTFRTTPQ